MAARKSLYGVHPGVAMVQKWIRDLPGKTGRTLEEWTAFILESGPAAEKERSAWLKKEHGLGTNIASWLAKRLNGDAMGLAEEDPATYLAAAPGYVDAMYSGGKAGLRPLYDALLRLGLSLGKDVKACPCTTIVPLYRKHVFAELKPSTRTRLDLGLALGDLKPTGRLIDTGGFARKNRITHRIAMGRLADIDDEVKGWLKTAYERDA
jgi:Domain of unknown function (DUF5655)/Domain of unknown function (DUF4287)